jgi:ATP-dependent helicase/nuclease subunit B
VGSIQILLGKTRVRRRRAIARNQLSGVDRFGRPNFLYITDTRRKVRTVEAEFLQYRDGAAFLPTVVTLSGLLAELATRHGDGRACWSSGGVALVAERLLQASPGEYPWLVALGDPERVGRALAELAEAWDEADRPAFEARPELLRFFERLLRDLAADRARRPLGDALRHLLETLGSPGVALTQWLAEPHVVVIDDVLHPSPLRRRVLVGLARAWSALGVHVVFAFESGRDLGGAEAGRFFEYADDDSVAFPLRPFQATRAFRRALFAALVAEGGEADLLVAGRHALRTVDPGDEPGPEEPADLADRLYAGPAVAEGDGALPDPRAVEEADDPEAAAADPDAFASAGAAGGAPGVGGLPRLVRWSDPAAEVRGIAHAVKERLLAGTPPEDLWVAFPGLPGYLPLVRRIFGELGIPVEISSGRSLRARPAAEIVVVAARAAAEGFPLGPLLAALASDLVGVMPESGALSLARACRERGITHGHPESWGVRLPPDDQAGLATAVDALAAACDALTPLATPVSPERWRAVLAGVIDTWRIIERAGHCPEPDARADSLTTLGRVLGALEGAANDAAAVDPGPWEPGRLVRLLEDRLEAARLPDLDVGARRVQVVGMLELRGIHPRWLWVGGLVADDFPARPAEDYLLPRAARTALDRLDPSDEARYLFASTLRNALAEGHTLTLSWPATRDDRPVAVSPLLEDLLELEVGGVPLRNTVVAGARAPTPAGNAELDSLLGEAAAAGADPGAWRTWLQDPDRIDTLAEVVQARRDPDAFGPWDGLLDRPSPVPSLGVTRLEDYLACPARYFHRQLLALEAEEVFDPDLGRSAQGRLLHDILDDFLHAVHAAGRTTLAGATPSERESLAATLHTRASARMAADPALGGLPVPLSGWHRQRWLAGLVDGAPKGLLAAWLDAEVDTSLGGVFDSTEHEFSDLAVGPLRLKGRIDRLDRLPGGAPLVIDYKTGRAPAAEDVRAGLKVQGFVYLEAVGPGDTGAAVYQELRGAATLAHAGWLGDAETLDGLGVPAKDAVVLGPAEADALRAHLADAGARLVAGRFHPSLAGPKRAGCEWCEFSRSCRVDHVRNAAIAARRDPRWQAPLGGAAEDMSEGDDE